MLRDCSLDSHGRWLLTWIVLDAYITQYIVTPFVTIDNVITTNVALSSHQPGWGPTFLRHIAPNPNSAPITICNHFNMGAHRKP